MELVQMLQEHFGQMITLEKTAPGISRIYAPFFHEDGDMISMYLQQSDNDHFTIRDFGNTLMRVSYTFDIDSENKRNILSSIIKSNHGKLDDGEIILEADYDSLAQAIFQYSQIVAKASNIDIIRRETIKSLFHEYLAEFVLGNLGKYGIQRNMSPTRDKQLVVDYCIGQKNPLFLFGVNENTKASKVVISCLTFQKQKIPFRSLIVHEDFDSLSTFYRNQITNAADKQYTSLDDFKGEGIDYIERQLVS